MSLLFFPNVDALAPRGGPQHKCWGDYFNFKSSTRLSIVLVSPGNSPWSKFTVITKRHINLRRSADVALSACRLWKVHRVVVLGEQPFFVCDHLNGFSCGAANLLKKLFLNLHLQEPLCFWGLLAEEPADNGKKNTKVNKWVDPEQRWKFDWFRLHRAWQGLQMPWTADRFLHLQSSAASA